MALSISQTTALADILKPGMRVASMGYPDLIAPKMLIDGMLGSKEPHLAHRRDSAEICKRHGLEDRPIPDAESFFKLLGCELDVYDIVQERGCEILCDLNKVGMGISYTKGGIWACYDIVLDVGTVEHCFNIGQAIINMAGLVKEGGYIIHENPHSGWSNHGFYSLHPTLFHDFYTANGFKLLDCRLVTRSGASTEVPLTQRFRGSQNEVNVFALAQRVSLQSFVFPHQSKYRKPDAAAPGEATPALKAKEQAHA